MSTAATSVPPLRRGRAALRRNVEGYLFILPWLLGFIIFLAGPMAASVGLAFVKWSFVGVPEWVGLGNFLYMFQQDLFYKSLYNTAYYTFIAVPFHLVVALLAAILVNQKVRWINFYRTAFYLPSIVPSVAVSYLWLWIFNPQFGLLNAAFELVGIPSQQWLFDPAYAKLAYIFMSLWTIGGAMIIYLAGLQNIPDSLYEAASVDGANAWTRLVHVTVPMLTPVIFFNLVMGIIGSFQIFTAVYLMTAGSPENSTLFYVLYLYRKGFEDLDFGYASALAWFLFLIIVLFTMLQFRLAQWWVYYEAEMK